MAGERRDVADEESSEREAIEAAKLDPRRFALLYEDNFDRVYAYVLRRVRNRTETEDLTSEVFHKALASLAGFEWRGLPFAAWLLRIAFHAIADHYNRRNREMPLAEDQEPSVEALEPAEDHARLFRAVDELPDDQRRVVRLRFAEEKSIRDVARDLGRSEGAVKQLQFRALQSLRARLGDVDG